MAAVGIPALSQPTSNSFGFCGGNNEGQQLTKAEIRTGSAICASLDKETMKCVDCVGFYMDNGKENGNYCNVGFRF